MAKGLPGSGGKRFGLIRLLRADQNSRFSPDELLRLKAFGIREPSLDASLEEMAHLLLTSVLPIIERISAQPIPSRH